MLHCSSNLKCHLILDLLASASAFVWPAHRDYILADIRYRAIAGESNMAYLLADGALFLVALLIEQ